jgi:hypothetical protein
MSFWVTITYSPMHLCTCVNEERGVGESVDSEELSLMSYTLRYVSLVDLDRLAVWVVITDAPVYIRERGGGGRGSLIIVAYFSVCLFATGLKKARSEGKKCHAKTMKNKKNW